ncbi:hypothetical protein Dimus_007051 [Dionaea muscipula]
MMEMEEKESSASGSPAITECGSPKPITQLLPPTSVRIGISVDGSDGAGTTSGGRVGAAEGTWSSGCDLAVGRRKKGRPRRYGYDGNVRVKYPMAAEGGGGVGSPPGFDVSDLGHKRGHGMSSGSANCYLLGPSGWFIGSTAGDDFTPYVVSVQAGEGPRGFCILSANGDISNVTLRQPGSSGGLLTYEGRFEILALTGSFTVGDAESGGIRSMTGGLSVSLAGPDGRVIGGGVAGLLRAASPIQIVVGSFIPNGYKAARRMQHSPSPNVPMVPHEPDHTGTLQTPIPDPMPESAESVRADLRPLPAENHEKEEGDHGQRDGQNLNEVSPYAAQWNLILS